MFVWSPKSPGTKGPGVGSSTSTLHWYGSGGEILAETDASGITQNKSAPFSSPRFRTLRVPLTRFFRFM